MTPDDFFFYNKRRLIGRAFDDPIVKKDVESWPFKVVAQGTQPAVEVEYLGENKTFTPQEISSMVLMKVSLGFYLFFKIFIPPKCISSENKVD